jgi:hypothetical protein
MRTSVPGLSYFGLGSETAFYITTTGTEMIDTVGTEVGATVVDDSFVEILEGTGVEYPFGAVSGPRIWNGTIAYNVCW